MYATPKNKSSIVIYYSVPIDNSSNFIDTTINKTISL